MLTNLKNFIRFFNMKLEIKIIELSNTLDSWSMVVDYVRLGFAIYQPNLWILQYIQRGRRICGFLILNYGQIVLYLWTLSEWVLSTHWCNGDLHAPPPSSKKIPWAQLLSEGDNASTVRSPAGAHRVLEFLRTQCVLAHLSIAIPVNVRILTTIVTPWM